MYALSQQDDLSFSYIRRELKGYSVSQLGQDLLAGLEVSLLTVPQAIAYALVAGLPPSSGLFAAIFSSLAACFFGSSRFLIVGPVNAIAILVQAGTADILYTYYWEASPLEKETLAIEIMMQIALLAGIFQIGVSVFKLGRLTQFVSHSVVVGYLAGGALAIITNQLFTFSGIPIQEGASSLYDKLYYFTSNLEKVSTQALFVGAASLASLLFLKKLNRRLPALAIVLILSGAVFFLLDLYPYDSFAKHVTTVGESLDPFEMTPQFSSPTFDPGIMNHIFGIAFAVALLSIIETACTAKSIASSTGFGISINQEILSVGLANAVSSFTGSMPVSVSNSRSQLNVARGAKTRLSAVFSAVFVSLTVLYFGNFVNSIPLPTLAAILFVTAVTLVNPTQLLLCIKSTRGDAFVLVTTFLACVFFSLDTAFYIGVILSISLYLKKSAMPQLAEYAIEESGELKSLEMSKVYLQKDIRVIKVEGELFFGSADIFYTTLKTIAEDDMSTKVILLQLKNARDIDATTCLALMQLHDYLKRASRHLVLSGMTEEMWDVMSNSGLIRALGKENVFLFDERYPQAYMQRAIGRARFLARKNAVSEEKRVETPLELADRIPLEDLSVV